MALDQNQNYQFEMLTCLGLVNDTKLFSRELWRERPSWQTLLSGAKNMSSCSPRSTAPAAVKSTWREDMHKASIRLKLAPNARAWTDPRAHLQA